MEKHLGASNHKELNGEGRMSFLKPRKRKSYKKGPSF